MKKHREGWSVLPIVTSLLLLSAQRQRRRTSRISMLHSSYLSRDQ